MVEKNNVDASYLRNHPRPTDASNYELWSWFFMRVSGVILWVLVLGHLFIMHILNNVAEVDFDFVAARWGNPLWRIYDWTMLVLALIHGLNGLRIILDDYVHNRGWRVFSISLLYVTALVFLIIGSLVVVTF